MNRKTFQKAQEASAERLHKFLQKVILSFAREYEETTIHIERENLCEVLRKLRDHPEFKFRSLMDITAVDWPGRKERFDVVYHLLSLHHNLRLRLICSTDEKTPIESCWKIFPSAQWAEREVWDMFGVLFNNHPDFRRLLTDYGFEGHPLRKDFPLTGHVEVRYSEEHKKVVYEPVKLPQAFRNFDFESPWEGMLSSRKNG